MEETVVALAGNPNVGKSTVFNALTGLHQHTGNWPGKTVALAEGQYVWRELRFRLVDLPGTYSLAADSPEEEIARDFLACGGARVVVVVTDATCLRRSLALALQIRQRTARMVLCVNLLDEAEKKGIDVDLARLSARVGAPVVGMAARSGRGLDELRDAVAAAAEEPAQTDAWQLRYDVPVERALARLAPALDGDRMRALALLERGAAPDAPYYEAWGRARVVLDEAGLAGQALSDSLAASVVRAAEEIAGGCVRVDPQRGHTRDRRIDRLLTSRRAGIPAMLLLLAGVLYLTIRGANVPSELLSRWLLGLQEPLRGLLAQLGAPLWLQGAAVDGVYRTAAWVTAVMLPPMAIFFPLFTLLEDAGYLPRVAFNLDRLFRAAGAHGRQSLTMCMGFGCNACGVTGCRIIDSPRERLVAILSNCFVPCNGRFPTLLALISLFFLGGSRGAGRTLLATGLFLLVILFSVAMTLLASRLLSSTVLRGEPSAFSLELPPYRMPQIGRVLVRSLLDRTLFVLGRAVTVAAPMGLLIWVLANVRAGGVPVLTLAAGWLDPLGRLMGLDGMILLAFVLGFPANEIVLPILLMGYLQEGSLTACAGLGELQTVFTANGWTARTAVCMVLLCLMHFPCGTTVLTIRRETGSLRWTAVGFLLPLGMGAVLCILANFLMGLTG